MKDTPRFVCQQCGNWTPKWQGQCYGCGEWNSIVEVVAHASSNAASLVDPDRPESIAELSEDDARRLPTGIGELDRVLGGGIVSGGSILIGGEPGIGKSTLLLQAAANFASANLEAEVLLVSAEESKPQIGTRARRLDAVVPNLMLYCESSCERIIREIQNRSPALVIIDSIQTIRSEALASAAGTVGQVRECAALLANVARVTGVSIVLVGHVTKDGVLAGPRTLEHLVDTVLTFEGDRRHGLRSLRAEKNRFGSSGEVSLFEMTSSGLVEISDASARLIRDRRVGHPGTAIAVTVEGHRPILLEIQALVSAEHHASGKRTAIGVDPQRLSLIVAVLERRIGVLIGGRDLYVSAAGGFRVEDPGVDLAVALAIMSAVTEVVLSPGLVAWGELGLVGELRAVSHAQYRYDEAVRLGFDECLIPQADAFLGNKALLGGRAKGVDSITDALKLCGMMLEMPA